uniref:Uncharacterized protein n=2 Tax=viral metagenome TaxID=1070528 RepID=A0A6M3JZL5_9ZZZZ
MPEETKSQVSLEDLEKAASGLMETDTITDNEPVEPPDESSAEENLKESLEETITDEDVEETSVEDEPTDHIVRSKLGRRVSAIETKIDSFMDEMRSLIKKENPDEFHEDDIDPDEPLTLRQLEKLEEKKTRLSGQYNSDYNNQIRQLEMEEDETSHATIMDEFLKNHNIKRSSNGGNDAKLNYLNAQIAVLKRSQKTKLNPLEKNDEKKVKGLGTPSGSTSDGAKGSQIKLDPDTKDLIDYFRSTPGGETWTDEKIANIMKQEPKARFSRFKR